MICIKNGGYLQFYQNGTSELTNPAKKKRNDFDNPPRPQNSWIIFRKDYEAHLRLRNPDVKQKVKHTAKECSLKWKSQPREVKHFFKTLEKIAYENHKHIYPNYKYKPKNAKDLRYKKFIFREQKKYPTSVSSHSTENRSSVTTLHQIINEDNRNDNNSHTDYLFDANYNMINDDNLLQHLSSTQMQLWSLQHHRLMYLY
ncbi:10754_t:CDS:2 [Ambispora gerdemannii]|uniref:10754_t:CDS:1 n=1 Tax=Ambispora gerdemannii TaxID=144530 RepID=A0A9N9BAP3_9GLOM|nr:10754_t:CDS:2 [Ambispora gerdemannii]